MDNSVLGLKVSRVATSSELLVTWQKDPCVSNYTLEYSLLSRLSDCQVIISPTATTEVNDLNGQASHYIVNGLEYFSVYTVSLTPIYENMDGRRANASGFTQGTDTQISKYNRTTTNTRIYLSKACSG